MKSLKTTIKSIINNKTWVAIKDTHISNVNGKPTKKTTYRIVELDTFKRLDKGVKLRINKETGKPEEYEDKNPHKVQELGRATSKDEVKRFLPTINSNYNN